MSQDTFLALLNKGYVKFGKWKSSNKRTITYLSSGVIKQIDNKEIQVVSYDDDGSVVLEGDSKVKPLTVWNKSSHSASDQGSSFISNIFLEKRFSFPKSLYATHDALWFFVANRPNALIVDFFGGSGTTLHSVNLLNAEDGGQRKCILITNNEVSEDEEKSMTARGLRPTDEEWENFGIARYVAWPRTVCAIEGHDVNGNPLKGNYIGSELPMSDGFEENAIFFDLEYLEPSIVSADLAFDRIAPILWLCGGCRGEILQRRKGYVIGETYAVLFALRYKMRFVDEIINKKTIETVFIVTDVAERYRSLCAELPGCRVMQLYESYLRSFEINAIG